MPDTACPPCLKWHVRGAQFELYSSRVAEFEVYGRRSHPRSDGPDYARGLNASAWQLLGRFSAANAKGTQVALPHRAMPNMYTCAVSAPFFPSCCCHVARLGTRLLCAGAASVVACGYGVSYVP